MTDSSAQATPSGTVQHSAKQQVLCQECLSAAANETLALRLLDAIAREDRVVLGELLDPQIVWRVTQGTVLPTLMKGKRAITLGFAPWFERKATALVFDTVRVLATSNAAIVEVTNHTTMVDGAIYRGEGVLIIDIEHGVIMQISEHLNPLLVNAAMAGTERPTVSTGEPALNYLPRKK